MGGPGSGSYPRWSAKTKVESCRVIDATSVVGARQLRECGGRYECRLVWTDRQSGEETASIGVRVDTCERPGLQLRYSLGADGERLEYEVWLTSTSQHLGGVRWWFQCPLGSCWRRCAKLYLPPGGKYFGCRLCYGLAYESQWESRSERMLRRAAKLHERLGGDGRFPEFTPPKPKGMHWRTYSRIACEERWLQENAWSVFAVERRLLDHPGLLQEVADRTED